MELDLIQKLDENLVSIIKVYRQLLSLVRKEREILIAANLDDLQQNNKAKEATLIKARQLEEGRLVVARSLAQQHGLDPETTRLLDFARHFGGATGDRLRQLHSVLDLLLKRVKEFNQQNELLVHSALDAVTGSMSNIRDTISEKRVYKAGGQMQSSHAEAGQLVSKEV
jgi:hypothetical protein